MNWHDALSHAHLDALTAIGSAASAAGPEELHRLVGGYLLHRVRGLPRVPGGLKGLEDRLRFPPPSAREPTVAGLTAWWVDQVGLPPSSRLLDAEGMIALLQWSTGTQKEPGGFFRLFWDAVEKDASVYGPELDRLDRAAEMVMLTLQDEARSEAALAERAPYAVRAAWLHLGRDGAYCHRDGDGHTSAALRASRRRLLATVTDRPNGLLRWALAQSG